MKKNEAIALARKLASEGGMVKDQQAKFIALTGFTKRYFFKCRAKAGVADPKRQLVGAMRELGKEVGDEE